MSTFELVPLPGDRAAATASITRIWNAASRALTQSDTLAISTRLADFNLQPGHGQRIEGRFAQAANGEVVGYVVAGAQEALGWVDSLAVQPRAQGRGVGGALLAWAEGWLHANGAGVARIGGGLRPWLPGYPRALGGESWFLSRGYAPAGTVWDVATDLEAMVAYPERASADLIARPATPGDVGALRDFFIREFPGRWRYEFEEHVREGGRMSDYIILLEAGRVEAFCLTTREDSLRPIDRFYLNGLPRPWGQAGPLGTAAGARGKGYAARVINAALADLHAAGVRGCIIDWTDLVDFYARFGFRPWRAFLPLRKAL